MSRVAVIGAGIAGLALAREIGSRCEVSVFEKSRGPGGRMATRSADPYRFDHGAQFFTARSDGFGEFLQPYIKAGLVARWDAEFVEIDNGRIASRRHWADGPAHYVAVPGMSALGKRLAADLDVCLETRIAGLQPAGAGWELVDESGQSRGEFEWVISTVPAAQARELLPRNFAAHAELASKKMLACYSLMLGFETPPALDWQAAFVAGADISWISNDSSKPGRPPHYSLLVHSTNRWAEKNVDSGREQVTNHLLEETSKIAGIDAARADHVGLHRWLYANIERQQGSSFYLDRGLRLGAVGDWCIHGRIEAAWQSARGLAGALEVML